MFKACVVCKQLYAGQYIYDRNTADWICTNCGCVTRKHCYATPDTVPFDVRVTTPPQALPVDRRINALVNPAGARADRVSGTIRSIALALDAGDIVRDRVESVLTKHEGILRKVHPKRKAIVATFVVISRIMGHHVNMAKVRENAGVNGCITAAVTRVSAMLNISLRPRLEKSIPYLASMLGQPYAFEKKLRVTFKNMTRKNANTRPETLLGMSILQLAPDTPRDLVSRLLGIPETSLHISKTKKTRIR